MSLFRPAYGFHLGPGGNPTGIGEYMRKLDEASLPFVMKSVDHYGPIFEAQQIMIARENAGKPYVPHVLIFRMSDEKVEGGYSYDTPPYKHPDYIDDPEGGAVYHWGKTMERLPPEFDRKRVILEVMNEVDKNLSSWLGRFCIKIAELAELEGIMVSFLGWSSGEPEPWMWETPEMLDLIRLVAANPHRLSFSSHEYSFLESDIFEGKGYKIGRILYLFAVCNKYNIPWPEVHITEFGWTQESVPSPEKAISDLQKVDNEYYARIPQIRSAAIWYLGGGFQSIADKTQQLILPVTNYIVNTTYPALEPITKDNFSTLPLISGWDQFEEIDNPVTIVTKTVEVEIEKPLNYFGLIRGMGKEGTIVSLAYRYYYYNEESGENEFFTDKFIDIPVDIPDIDHRGVEFWIKAVQKFKKTVTVEIECEGTPPPDPVPDIKGFLVSDVSHHQGTMNFSQTKSGGVQAVMIKATESNYFTSSKFSQFVSDARAVYGSDKHLVIPYHYYRFNVSPESQAAYFLAALESLSMQKWPTMIDIEDPDNSAVGKAGELKKFLDIVEYVTGYRPILYTGSWWWTNARWGGAVSWAKNYFVVEAEYVADPAYPAYADLDKSLGIASGMKPSLASDFDPGKILTHQFSSKIKGSLFGATSQYIDMQLCHLTMSEYKSAVMTPSTITSDPRIGQGNIDTLGYLRGDNGVQTDNQLIGQTQTYNYQHTTPDGKEWVLAKGSDGKGTVEYYYHDDNYIYRLYDTSENSVLGWWYAHYTNGKQGAVWLPRKVSVGEVFTSVKQVSHYQNSCTIRDGLDKIMVTDSLRVVALHDTYTLTNGVKVNDVLELYWIEGGETYLFAKGLGLIGFYVAGQKGEYTNTLFGRSPLTWTAPSCITSERFFA